jgi:hypothetical protein
VKETKSKSELDDVKSKGNLNSNNLPQMLHPEVNVGDVAGVQDGYHTTSMGPNHRAIGPNKGYRPTPGLINLFCKTGTGCKNPRQ